MAEQIYIDSDLSELCLTVVKRRKLHLMSYNTLFIEDANHGLDANFMNKYQREWYATLSEDTSIIDYIYETIRNINITGDKSLKNQIITIIWNYSKFLKKIHENLQLQCSVPAWNAYRRIMEIKDNDIRNILNAF